MKNRSATATRLKQGNCPREVDDAIAFLHSMIALVEARGLAHVEEQFASTMMGMATRILVPWGSPVSPQKAIAYARSAINAAVDLLEELGEEVPTSILKGAVMMIETTIRAAQGKHVEKAANRAA